uniref:Uncharacterized protein n=1 Tax=Parastrongyloides trichosuri TaxID=131310 RepID=A0A0N4ZF22_PARTI
MAIKIIKKGRQTKNTIINIIIAGSFSSFNFSFIIIGLSDGSPIISLVVVLIEMVVVLIIGIIVVVIISSVVSIAGLSVVEVVVRVSVFEVVVGGSVGITVG